ncbi:MAG: S-layer homology domain-containing protein [Clostridia bacterium]|nr:S-layer homology domain-containing protein [Clostridia bacterium]
MKKRTIGLFLALCTAFSSFIAGVTANAERDISSADVFVDVKADSWFRESVDYVYNNGLMKGTSKTKFAPNVRMSRSMLVTVLWRYEGSPSGYANSFKDIPENTWYTDAVSWAGENGVVSGVAKGIFDPEGDITREQVTTIMYRYNQYIGFDVSAEENVSEFPDAGEVSDWAKDGMNWAISDGIINGKKDSSGTKILAPGDNVTRAEVAAILTRYCSNVSDVIAGLITWIEEVNSNAEKSADNICKKIYSVKSDINDGWIDNSGVVSASGNYRHTDLISVKTGETITYRLSHGVNDAPVIAFYDASGAYDPEKSILWSTGSTYVSGVYTVPADGYVRMVYLDPCDDVFAKFTDVIPDNVRLYYQNVSDVIAGIQKQIIEIRKSAEEAADSIFKKVFSIRSNVSDGWINTSGSVSSTGNYKFTDYISVKEGDTITYKLSHGVNEAPMIAFYDGAKTYDPSKSVLWSAGGNYRTGTYTAPADGYVRMVYLDSCRDVFAIFMDAIPDYVRINDRKDKIQDLNVLLLGDSIFGNDGEINGFIDKACKSSVNGAFGGTSVCDRGSGDFRYFDGVRIVRALTENTWADQDAAAEALSSSYPWITGRLEALKSVDMSAVDIIIMNWGTNDYTQGKTTEEIVDAYESVIDMLGVAFPSVRILIATPIWRYWGTADENENGDTKVYNVSTLKEIVLTIEEFAKDKRISVLNAYQEMPLSYNTASTYFDKGDGTHLNVKGNEVFAGLLIGKLRGMFN